MSQKFSELRLRNVGDYVAKNFKFGAVPSYLNQAMLRYQAKYVHVKNARMTPFWHFVGMCMLVNYMIDYKYHLKYEKHRKYH